MASGAALPTSLLACGAALLLGDSLDRRYRVTADFVKWTRHTRARRTYVDERGQGQGRGRKRKEDKGKAGSPDNAKAGSPDEGSGEGEGKGKGEGEGEGSGEGEDKG